MIQFFRDRVIHIEGDETLMSGLGPVERHRAADRFVFSVIIVATKTETHVAAPVEKAVDIRENADLHILPY